MQCRSEEGRERLGVKTSAQIMRAAEDCQRECLGRRTMLPWLDNRGGLMIENVRSPNARGILRNVHSKIFAAAVVFLLDDPFVRRVSPPA